MSSDAPTLTLLADFAVDVATPVEIGRTTTGTRRIVPIVGGTVTGPELNGRILAGGADFQTFVTATLTELEARYAIETDDGERIYVVNRGIRTGSTEDLAALARGEVIDAARIYFRSTPTFEPADERWAWLAERVFVATGERTPDQVRLRIWTVD